MRRGERACVFSSRSERVTSVSSANATDSRTSCALRPSLSRRSKTKKEASSATEKTKASSGETRSRVTGAECARTSAYSPVSGKRYRRRVPASVPAKRTRPELERAIWLMIAPVSKSRLMFDSAISLSLRSVPTA